ncbi:hypothetical protein MKK88_11015 [Methylobacterium sp. E-005]|uniref:hypothetical protein n=1 Tax=Methylobacterium sp. E-005 TaxID=2836549 RepID=UPI001FBA57A5|nr:hypothetical protein [Methylobacterium sp. E-005]MCJ2086517.1 hypothetical protein [Methylobacterium sp. E-005]
MKHDAKTVLTGLQVDCLQDVLDDILAGVTGLSEVADTLWAVGLRKPASEIGDICDVITERARESDEMLRNASSITTAPVSFKEA